MNLIIFDVDGTLTQTNDVDSQCFLQALNEILPKSNKKINANWSEYKYSTDSGLLNEIYEYLFARLPSLQEINVIKECFIRHLKEAWAIDDSSFKAIVGAEYIFNEIGKFGNWHIAIATGAWKSSALFKLNSANIPHSRVPKVYAENHIERTEIIKVAIDDAKRLYHTEHYARTIYVGDRDWDLQAAKKLNIEFVGIGNAFADTRHINLELNDYKNANLLLSYLSC